MMANLKWVPALLLSLSVLAGCTREAPPAPTPCPPQGEPACSTPVNLIDTNYPLIAEGQENWQYRKEIAADLDGDGTEETVVVTTGAAWIEQDRTFAWDDGQVWKVYVQEAGGTRTCIFSGWVQLGRLEVYITDDRQVLIASSSHGITLYQVRYRGPNQHEAVRLVSVPTLGRAWFQDPRYTD